MACAAGGSGTKRSHVARRMKGSETAIGSTVRIAKRIGGRGFDVGQSPAVRRGRTMGPRSERLANRNWSVWASSHVSRMGCGARKAGER